MSALSWFEVWRNRKSPGVGGPGPPFRALGSGDKCVDKAFDMDSTVNGTVRDIRALHCRGKDIESSGETSMEGSQQFSTFCLDI